MANVWGTPSYKRVLWNSDTEVANSTAIKVAGSSALLQGTFGIFWPVNEAGVLGQGQTVNGIWITYSDGTAEKLTADLTGSTKGTITLTNSFTADKRRIISYVTSKEGVGILRLELELEEWNKATYGQLEAVVLDLWTRVTALEEAAPTK